MIENEDGEIGYTVLTFQKNDGNAASASERYENVTYLHKSNRERVWKLKHRVEGKENEVVLPIGQHDVFVEHDMLASTKSISLNNGKRYMANAIEDYCRLRKNECVKEMERQQGLESQEHKGFSREYGMAEGKHQAYTAVITTVLHRYGKEDEDN